VFVELLRQKLAGIYELSDEESGRLKQHYELLMRWNKVLNLTSITTLEESVERHYCESIFAACRLPKDPISLADLGSGPGFPGIPIAIARPLCRVTLIESHQRKAVFLREASRDLPNVRVLASRAKDVAKRFDWVVSRAVKYSDIASDLKRLGSNVEILTGELRPADTLGVQWREPIRLPWGNNRYLWIGRSLFHVERSC
jgi:16S rRNA (guanine527-N7)-methyltransferase